LKNLTSPLPPLRAPKLLDQLRKCIRYLHCSLRTEEGYVYWALVFIRFHGIRHLVTMKAPEVEDFLSWLVNERNASTSTHSQALSALLFLYEKVLGVNLPWLMEIGRPHIKERLPVVLVPDEVAQILAVMDLFGALDIGCRTCRIPD
jgi:site-specific recombinase XerD